MKLIIVSVTVLIALNFAYAGEKKSGMIKAIAGKCKKQENASDDDLDKMSKGEPIESKEGKCMAACLGEQFGMLKDNKLDTESAMKKMGKMMGKDDDKKQKMEESLKACAETTDADRCEAADKIFQCLKAETKKRGIDFMN
ncbi:general odorant-binding protein 28a-like [Chironomus tepperi]|uniref:general odorant-binding protein 28a-like n=1 Tax=Chironomus tepperi TaxID=113505 RepID=UPI00391F0094